MYSIGRRLRPAAVTMDNRECERTTIPNYYAAFVYDPDGNNIEVVCRKG